jgi:hypothetical protein
MKPFSKREAFSLGVIFVILVGISIPNFVISLRRARDQVRKDDMGALQKVLGEYFADFRTFPLSSPDGKMLACKAPEDEVEVDEKGNLIIDFKPCEWGQDAIVDFTPGSDRVYMRLLPREPNYQEGAAYRYISDGSRMQMFVSLEGEDEPEYDQKIIARGLKCGNLICNAGRFYSCSTEKSLDQCALEELKK